MRVWAPGGQHPSFWLSLPPARSVAWAQHNVEIDQALRQAAARVPGARYLDIQGPITDHGRYADFVTVNGRPDMVREPDGIHLTQDGSSLVAQEVMRKLTKEWRLR